MQHGGVDAQARQGRHGRSGCSVKKGRMEHRINTNMHSTDSYAAARSRPRHRGVAVSWCRDVATSSFPRIRKAHQAGIESLVLGMRSELITPQP
jgi:hypothetical protein